MIGILYTNGKRKVCTKRLNYLFGRFVYEKYDPIIAFSISDINIEKEEVAGDIISESQIKSAKVPLPSVIFNMALNEDKDSIKKLRYILNLKNVKVINNANKFDQWMIMEMASHSAGVGKYFLPYHLYDKEKRNFKPDDTKSYIVMPSRGSSISRIIYTKLNTETGKLEGNMFFKRGHICDYIDASMCQKRWIFIEVPSIVTIDNMPVIERFYLQKGIGGVWGVIGKSQSIRGTGDKSKLIEPPEDISLRIINHINHFLPNLGGCFIDTIIGDDGARYFLHLGGLDHSFLFDGSGIDMYRKFFGNIIYTADNYRLF